MRTVSETSKLLCSISFCLWIGCSRKLEYYWPCWCGLFFSPVLRRNDTGNISRATQHHPCGDFNPVQWLASGHLHFNQHKVTFCWLIMAMFQHVYIKLFLPNHYWRVTTCRDPNVTPFHFQCPDREVAWHSLMVWCYCTTEVYFVFCQIVNICQEKKWNCPYIIYGYFSLLFL